MRSRRTRVVMVALAAAVALVAAACGTSGGGNLLVAADTSQQQQARSDVWAVRPGDPIDASALVARDVTSPLSISTVEPDGLQWLNQLGRAWSGSTLMAYGTGTSSGTTSGSAARSLVTAGDPGGKATTLGSSTGGIDATVLRRGVAIRTPDGCSLATGPSGATSIAKGSCQISDDERWAVSWPQTPGALTIRDLGTGTTRRVTGIETIAAVVLDRDARVLAVTQVPGGVRGVVIDATDGTVVGHTPTYDQMQAIPSSPDAAAFVALVLAGQQVRMLWITPDAAVRTVDRGEFMVPVLVGSDVTYLRLDRSASKDSLRRWTPDGSGGDREVLLTGRVGAAAATPDSIVATRDTDAGVELYRTGPSGGVERVLTLRTDASSGSLVTKMLVQGDLALLQITTGQESSFVRVHLSGDGSDAPIRNWPYLLLESVDTDGTALLTGTRGTSPDSREDILVVGPDDSAARVRGRSDTTGFNLIHDGVVYYTDQPRQGSGSVSVRSVRATGERDTEVLYRGYQIAGATWPQDNGATESLLISRARITAQQQQAQGQTGG